MAARRMPLLMALIAILVSAAQAQAGGIVTWTSTGGPTGGLINALAAVANVPGVMYAGTNGGIYLTRDAGAHWQLASDGLENERAITALAASPEGTLVLAGTHSGVFRTRDSGGHWTVADPRFTGQLILSLAIDPLRPSLVYAGTATSVFKSDDAGETWTDVGQDLRAVQVWALALTRDSSALYAATDTGVYVTRDRGGRWTRVSDGLPEGARAQALTISERGIFVGTAVGLFYSADGRAWNRAGGTFGGNPVRPILVDPRRAERVFAVAENGLVKSTDGGSTWSLVSNAPNDAPIFALEFADKGALYIGTARGIWKTEDDGANWQLLNVGLASSSVYSMIMAPGRPATLLAATRFGLWLSQDRGATWKEARGITDSYVFSVAVDPTNPQSVYAGTWGSGVFVSADGGRNFSRLVGNLAANAPVSSLAVSHLTPDSAAIVAGTLGNGVFRSTDAGKTWSPLSAGLGGLSRVTVLTFVSPASLYAGTERGLFRIDASNAGAQWARVSPALPTDEVRSILVSPDDPKKLYVTFDVQGLFHSEDTGANWASLGQGAFHTRSHFQAFAVNPGNSQVIYIGTDRGIYRSEDDGKTWSASNNGLPPGADVQAIAIDPEAVQKVFIGTDGDGVITGTDDLPIVAPSWLGFGIAGVILLGLVGAGFVFWRTRYSPQAQEQVLEQDWPKWEGAITNALWTFGQANEINLNEMPRRSLSRALQRYAERRPDDGLTLQQDPVALRLDSYIPAQKFFSHWKAAWEIGENPEAFASVTSLMVDQFCEFHGFTRVEERAYKGLIGYVVRAPALRLKIPPRFPIIFIPHHEVSEEDIHALRDLMGILNMMSYFALIIDLRDAPDNDQRQSLKRLVHQAIHDFIVLDGRDMRNLLGARDHARRLIDVILDQVDLTVVSPYVTSGPVPENMFFGREHELKTIMRTVGETNFAIVGGRKIGKTSVLARVYKLLQEAPEFQPFYLDCQAVFSDTDFFEAIETLWHTTLAARTPEGFRRMATDLQSRHPDRSLVMLFDEIDGLLQYDAAHGEYLFRIFRALSQESQVRFIFCGEKLLNDALHDPQLVFFNFCNVLPLSYLTPAEAIRVVLEPMQEMGIAIEEDGVLADHIVQLTAGHPNIVQFVCQKLLERINARGERLIARADVDALGESAQFAEYFVSVSWGNANPLEKFITLLMLDCPQVTASEMGALVRTHDLDVTPAQLEQAFDGLVLYSILRRDGPKYAFAADAFPFILRRSQDVNGLLASLIPEIKTGNGGQE